MSAPEPARTAADEARELRAEVMRAAEAMEALTEKLSDEQIGHNKGPASTAFLQVVVILLTAGLMWSLAWARSLDRSQVDMFTKDAAVKMERRIQEDRRQAIVDIREQLEKEINHGNGR